MIGEIVPAASRHIFDFALLIFGSAMAAVDPWTCHTHGRGRGYWEITFSKNLKSQNGRFKLPAPNQP
jgi:hypothetical protein